MVLFVQIQTDLVGTGRFATSISCMDGRVQPVLSDWIRKNYPVDFVDTITAPGVDGRIAKEKDLGPLIDMVGISVKVHKSRLIVVSGHYQCAGNPVSDEEHKAHIRSSVDLVSTWEREHALLPAAADGDSDAGSGTQNIDVVGVWVDSTWTAIRIV